MRILFVHQKLWPYVERDLRILSEAYEVRECHFRGLHDIGRLLASVFWCDTTFSWFGSLHAFFAVAFSRLLNKRSVVVAGGWDVGQPPDGLVFQRWKRWCPQYVFRSADMVLSVSMCSYNEALANIRGPIKDLRMIYHGFDTERFRLLAGVQKNPRLVMTVGTVSKYYVPRKGLSIFVQAARYLPDIAFRLVGDWWDRTINELEAIAAPNVKFVGRILDEELIQEYNEAVVYVQASTHEAFGCSVAEAMLCECVPVVSRRAALPEVVGDCGFYVDDLEPAKLAIMIQEALQAPPEMGRRARQRIVDNFPLEKRRQELLAAIASLGEK